MSYVQRAMFVLAAFALMLAACTGGGATVPTPEVTPTLAPSATAVPTPLPTAVPTAVPTATPEPPKALARGVFVAGVDVGDLLLEEARVKVEGALAPLLRPLEVRVGSANVLLRPEDIGYALSLDKMLIAAVDAEAGKRIDLQVRYDEGRLRAALERLEQEAGATPPAFSVITSTNSISRSFVLSGGERLDIDAALKQIDERLRSPGAARRITLALARPDGPGGRPDPALLQEQIEAMAKKWKGIVGVYVYDLGSDTKLASLNQDTVFSGASVMKVPILLRSYLTIGKFSEKQEQWLRKMIVNSDNLAANNLLAASVGGSGTDDALAGALAMSEMLNADFGLKHTYQNMPYESREYLINVRKIKIKRGPPQEGSPPYTEPDPVLRTTPAEMSQIFLMISQCSQGRGLLLEKYSDTLNQVRCQEMIDRLEKNGDKSRMLSGLPSEARVAHKSGWIEDMQADVGIVRSPGGDFLVAIYVFQPIISGKTYLDDRVAAPVIGHFARLVYTYYNPVVAKAR